MITRFLFASAILLLFSACDQKYNPGEPIPDDMTAKFAISVEQGSSQSTPASYAVANDARDHLIRRVSIYVFSGETLTTVGHFGSVKDGGFILMPLPLSEQKYSAFVVANIQIKDPQSKSDLLKMMSDVEIGANGIPDEGMPMASGELEVLPGSGYEVQVKLQRCHSVLYVETPNGRNNDYDIFLYGEQRLQGALIVGNENLAPLGTNSVAMTPGYTLSATSNLEPVAYFYPTNGPIVAFIKLAGNPDVLRFVNIPPDKTKMRNKKYLLRIIGSPSKSIDTLHYPQVELISR